MQTGAPELIEDDDDEMSETEVEQLPPEKFEPFKVNIPYDATGSIVKINGEPFHGPFYVVPNGDKRGAIAGVKCILADTFQTIENMLGEKRQIEHERLRPRGNLLSSDDLAAADTASRIISRRARREL